MKRLRRRRLRAPALMVIIGSLIALAEFVAKGWSYGAQCEGIVFVAALGYYWLGGTDSDMGAMLTSRADERQVGIRQRGRAVAALAMLAAALVGAVVSLTLDRPAWPFALVAAIGVVSFAVGLKASGATLMGAGSDLLTMIVFRADERQKDVMQRAAKVAQLSMLAAAILGVIIFTGTKSDGEFGLITVVSVASVLAVFFVNRSGRQSRGEPQ